MLEESWSGVLGFPVFATAHRDEFAQDSFSHQSLPKLEQQSPHLQRASDHHLEELDSSHQEARFVQHCLGSATNHEVWSISNAPILIRLRRIVTVSRQ